MFFQPADRSELELDAPFPSRYNGFMENSPVSLRKEKGISIIAIDDGKANVFSLAMTQGLNAALDEIDTKTGAVVIVGRDGLYSGGFDLNVIRGGDPQATQQMITNGILVALRAFDFPRPIVAAVTGHAVAMGSIFNMGLDWRIGAQGNFRHGLNEVRDGLTLPIFAIELPRFRLNPRLFEDATLRSRMFSPEDAIEAGFLDEVVEPDELLEAAVRKAEELSTLPNPAYALSKKRSRAPTKKYVLETMESDLEATRTEAEEF